MTKFKSFVDFGNSIDGTINAWRTAIKPIKILNWQLIKYDNSQLVCVLIEYTELDEALLAEIQKWTAGTEMKKSYENSTL